MFFVNVPKYRSKIITTIQLYISENKNLFKFRNKYFIKRSFPFIKIRKSRNNKSFTKYKITSKNTCHYIINLKINELKI